MGTFRSIDELIRALDREKVLLKEMFAKRHSLQFRYDYALEMTEYNEERIRFLLENGVIRDTGDCLEMEDVYQKFFEDVLEMYRDIIFGNNRRQELLPYHKFAIVESSKYQNIPRTIQNVFLNTKLDADFIKHTIIQSMSDENVFIDLTFYREQIKEFEQEYKDVSLWTKENSNGETIGKTGTQKQG